MTLLRYAKRIWDEYNADSGGLIAAAIAFYGLLSLLPILALGVAVLGWFLGGSEEALQRAKVEIRDVIPVSGELIYGTLAKIKQESGLAGLIGLGGLLMTSSAIFGTLEQAFDTMWRTEHRRVWWQSKLIALGATIASLALMFASVGVTAALTWAQNARGPGIGLQRIHVAWEFAGNLVPLIFSTTTFTLVYRLVPNAGVSWRHALKGGIFAGIAWELAKYLFALYVAHYAHYDKVYGSLGAIVSLMFWAYYSAVILLLGGEIASLQPSERTIANTPEPQSHA